MKYEKNAISEESYIIIECGWGLKRIPMLLNIYEESPFVGKYTWSAYSIDSGLFDLRIQSGESFTSIEEARKRFLNEYTRTIRLEYREKTNEWRERAIKKFSELGIFLIKRENEIYGFYPNNPDEEFCVSIAQNNCSLWELAYEKACKWST